MSEPKLKRCPFCGGGAARLYETGVGYQVMCPSCGARTREAAFPNTSGLTMSQLVEVLRRRAIRLWNTRKYGGK